MIAYLDGFNIYNGLMAKGWGRYRWLDYRALMARYMRGEQHLVEVKYFTSRMTHQPDKLARQDSYLRALEVRGGITILTGSWSARKVQCRRCEKTFKVPQEKHTDVNIATHLVADAYEDRFDTFMLCTADSDLTPAVALVRERFDKRFILIDPPRRHSDGLAAVADVHLHSRKYLFRQSQLPNPVLYRTRRGAQRAIECPPSWLSDGPSPKVWHSADGTSYCATCNQALPSSS